MPSRYEMMWRFNRLHIPEPNSGCWLWIGADAGDGYGLMREGKLRRRAHQVAYNLFKGPIPEGLIVRHKCDVPCCVNPDHLELGTYADNARDRVERGRSVKGEGHWSAKLTATAVTFIRTEDRPAKYLAALFGVTERQILNIRAGTKWRDTPSSEAPAKLEAANAR